MAFLRLGSKSEIFHREGHTWVCTSGLPSDICINTGEMSFNLHKFPLLSRSGLLEKLIEEYSNGEGSSLNLRLDDIPGGAKAFELISKFCYGVRMELTAYNIVCVRCAAEYLRMTEDYGDGNLVMQAEAFLNEVLGNWSDSVRALEACEEVMPQAEELHIVSRCIESLATKASTDPSLFSRPSSGRETRPSPEDSGLWNGISTATKTQHTGEDWWYQDVSFLSLLLYRRLILAIESRGLRPETIAASVVHYARRYLPLMNRQSSFDDVNSTVTNMPNTCEADQRALLEEIVGLLPNKKGVTSTKFLIRLLRIAMVLHTSPSCQRESGDEGGSSVRSSFTRGLANTEYGQAAALATPPGIAEEGQIMKGSPDSLTPITMVANLIDGFLAEVASDVNFKLPKFEALAATIPDYARPVDDGLYHAIDVYMKTHHWIADGEREQLCRLMNCQKLSLEASTHAAQNERLPLRVIVQVLFFEQLRLRTSISGWFFVSDNLENSQNQINSAAAQQQRDNGGDDDVKQRVSELEKDCSSMKEEIQKLMKTKRSWRNFTRRLGFNRKSNSCCPKGPKASKLRAVAPSSGNRQQNSEKIEVVPPETLKVN
ncbi:hypothetical protein GOBAR_AA27632 [Gossypium barbadense]|uniref:NPH3 domain-containing protein n=1 Tax=Gossypium barbadense TaxID=3634 RepID=A0A2P5WPM7_GOSBA|nr:hypothetical protein GOBAR_AA27632 [Gossypium barbadense]